MTTAFLWRLSSNNVGDRHSGWPLWFEFDNARCLCLDRCEAEHTDLSGFHSIVVGGGLAPDSKWYPFMSAELDRHKRVLYAGVGRNIEEHMSHSVMWRHGLDAVPCPSCMSDLFDRQYETRHERCWYENVDILPLPGEPGSPKKSNTCISMEDAISFLASAETVITSSYHGAYWASLLGREVVLVGHRGKFADPCWKQPWFNLETARERAFAAFKKIVEFAHAIA